MSAEGFGSFGNDTKSIGRIGEISNNNFNLRSEPCNPVAGCVEAAFEGFVLVEGARCEDDVCAFRSHSFR